MMSVLNRFINDPDSESRIRELKKDKNAQQFMFVDEFQDTDDSQIESLLRIAQVLDYKLFLVGDIKQCIYRFRGAKEKAFDQLGIEKDPSQWLQFPLRRNYRTDKHLLDIFDRSFTAWGQMQEELLTYVPDNDRLIGTRDFNGSYLAKKDRFYRRLPATNEEMRIPVLVEEIKRIQKRIDYEESHGMKLSAKEKSVAILVRENWQADMIRTECARLGISVHTNTGGDLYMSQPAIDMLTLVNALVHFDEADYLYNLVTSNFFNLDIPKSNLYEIRMKIRTGGWRAKTDEKEQVNYLINFMNLMLANTVDKNNKWEYIVASLRTQPILQAIRKVYSTLEPWKHFSDDPWKQHYYQLNVDLLFEQLINACNVDRLTINTLQEHLHNSIVSQVSVDSRTPTKNEDVAEIQCITVHKSKGLEYGHVIMPFCSASMDFIKKTQLHISTTKHEDRHQIGYSMSVGNSGETVQNEYYDEIIEKSEKAREEARVLYVAMTRAIRSFSWVEIAGKQNLSWQNLIETEV
jgi:ATP-dependent exoDNAse (exonuclease V) beta subunit